MDVPSQLLVTVTVGDGGGVFGTTVPEPAALVQPFNVCVTVKVPGVNETITEPVAPVLHNNDPV
jgi:hypothetical protein